MEIIKEMPFSKEAEQAVLGSIFLEPDRITEVLDIIKEEHFYIEKNRHIFSAMCELFNNNQPIDIVTVGNLLMGKGIYDTIGGNDYIKDIINNMPLSLNVSAYAQIIKNKFIQRSLIKVSGEISDICYKDDSVSSMLDIAIDKVFNVARERENGEIAHIKTILFDNYNKLSEIMKNGEHISGISTGYKYLDSKILGMQPGNLILIAARPGMGKSSFAANIAQNVAIRQNIPTAIFTLEMSKEELANRIICSEAKIDNKKIKSADLSEQDILKYIDAMDPVASAPLYIDDTPSISYTELRAKCKRLKLEKNLGLVVVDYLQLMSGTSRESRQQEISEISRNLKLIAKELSIPVIALSQLSRAVEQRKDDHRPMLSDLRESGAIEQDADIVMFLYRDEVYNEDTEAKNICECIVAKNRAGETGSVKLTWIGEFTTFYTFEGNY
ncbi:MAG: replicative DNA helicase [Clostridia bacterium]|nr:replicative DNA helicase [Clostridia bacterium]